MRILTLTVILGLPLMALGQTEPQQTTTTQGQTNDTQTTAPAKAKKTYGQEQGKTQAKPDTATSTRAQTGVKGVKTDATTGTRSGTSQTDVSGTSQTNVNGTTQTGIGTNQTTTVNKQEFRSQHSEVFSLGRHPKEFFVQKYGANHVRLIGNTYFAYVDGCWVAVDVDGFVYSQRVICQGDPDFVVVD